MRQEAGDCQLVFRGQRALGGEGGERLLWGVALMWPGEHVQGYLGRLTYTGVGLWVCAGVGLWIPR